MLNKKSKIQSSIKIKTLMVTVLVFLNFGLTFAQTPASPTPAPASGTPAKPAENFHSLNVGKYLSTEAQGQAYLCKEKNKDGSCKTGTQNANPVAAFILQIINFITLTAASLSFLAVVIGGFLMMSSAGSENFINKGKEILQHAIVGLVITLSAYFIVAFVQNLLFESAAK